MKTMLFGIATAMLAVASIAVECPAQGAQSAQSGEHPSTPLISPGAVPSATTPPAVSTPRQAPAAAGPLQPSELDRPQPLKVTLLAGGDVIGQVVRWDVDGLDATVEGGPRRLQWDEIVPNDLYRLRKRLIDLLEKTLRRDAGLELAAYFYSRSDAGTFGDRAFDDAKRWGAEPSDHALVKTRGEERRQARNERSARADRARLAEGSPEAALFGNTAWPKLSPDEQLAAIAALRKEVAEMLSASGRDATPVESRQCLVYSTISLADAARRATEVDEFIEVTLPRLGLAKEHGLWFGRLVVIESEDRDRFALVEAAMFKSQPRGDEVAITHYDGPKAYVHLLKQTDEVGSRIALSRAVALAMLHRFHSATRLPAWANEGFADWLVAIHRPTKSLDTLLRRPGLASIRASASFTRAASIAYVPHAWPFPDGSSRGETYVLASFCAERHREAFLSFAKIVKSGEPWPSAFKQAFDAPLERVLDAAWEFHRVND